jgi:4-hydroxy-3-polyprenylbenzoate decarboxylase
LGPEDLQTYIAWLDQAGELARVKCPVDPDMEIAAVQDAAWRDGWCRQALLFENVRGYQIPVAMNLFGSRKRIEMAIGSGAFTSFPGKLHADLVASGETDSTSALRRVLANEQNLTAHVTGTACFGKDLANEGLNILPAIKAWPGDGGRYLTLCQVFTYHPETYAENCGMYRIQLIDRDRALLRCHPGSGGAEHLAAWHARGEAMPVAIALGGPPVMTWLAGVPLPGGVSETAFAGYLTGKPVAMSRCRDQYLAVPASAEIVIEGRICPGNELIEGPFGNHTGRYQPASPAPVINVEKISLREGAVYPCTLVGPPPRENSWLAELTVRTLLVLLKFDYPWVHDLHMPAEGVFHRAAMISIAPDCPLELTAIGTALWRSVLLKGSRLLILLDKDDPLSDFGQVYWRIVNAVEDRRFCHSDNSRVILDARLPEGTRRVETGEDMAKLVQARWAEYGLPGVL